MIARSLLSSGEFSRLLGVPFVRYMTQILRIAEAPSGTHYQEHCSSNGTASVASREDAGRTREYGELAVQSEGAAMRLFFSVSALLLLLLSAPASAQQGHPGHHGVGHAQWHEKFYNTLMRKDTKTSCCDMSDCRPTESRMIGDHYEVVVDGEWTRADPSVIQKLSAPDGGAHVCAPKQQGANKGRLYCVVLPPES
jgi:hypothetical protein